MTYNAIPMYNVTLFCYQQPQRLDNIDCSSAEWYQEGKQILSTYSEVRMWVDGFRTIYRVVPYKFHNVGKEQHKLDRLQAYIRKHPEKYVGIQHHLNLYDVDTKQFVKRILL